MAVAERSALTPLYEEVHRDRVFGGWLVAISIFMIVGIPWSAIVRHEEHPHEPIPIAALVLVLFLLLPMPPIAYFGVYPMRVMVDKEGLILLSGKIFRMHNKTIPFSSITAIRRSRYKPLDYEKSDKPISLLSGAQLWRMGGKEVLEIDAQDSRRLIILSSRADQLASLLHEMTRVPVEDFR